jgi:hypothetical protein
MIKGGASRRRSRASRQLRSCEPVKGTGYAGSLRSALTGCSLTEPHGSADRPVNPAGRSLPNPGDDRDT